MQDFNIDPRFPMLERLMELCWNQDATQRPSAKDILTTSHMTSADFLAQHKHFPRELEEVDFVTSVTEVNQQPYKHWFITEFTMISKLYWVVDISLVSRPTINSIKWVFLILQDFVHKHFPYLAWHSTINISFHLSNQT